MLTEKVWAAPGQVAKVAGCWSTVLQRLQGPGLLSAAPSLSGGSQYYHYYHNIIIIKSLLSNYY